MSVAEGAVCRPNFSGAGRKRRVRIAQVGAVVTVALLVYSVAIDLAPEWRALMTVVPAWVAAISWFQVRRNTCVTHARLGTFEHEDFSRTKADEADAAASRAVARTIRRDGFLAGLLVAGVSAASALVP